MPPPSWLSDADGILWRTSAVEAAPPAGPPAITGRCASFQVEVARGAAPPGAGGRRSGRDAASG
jgi:hypothetical protein